ncbi:MAG: ABC transporter permease [Planctomycetota bacterium]
MPRGRGSLWIIGGWWVVLVASFFVGEWLHSIYCSTITLQAHTELYPWPFRIFGVAWLIYGTIRWQENRWVERLSNLTIAAIVAYLLGNFFHSIGWDGGTYATIAALAMGLTFIGGMFVIRQLLRGGHPVLGVASTVVAEAMRMRVPVVFLALLTLTVPFLPFTFSDNQLRYQVQSFLSYSLTATSMLLALMTLFLSVGTVCSEIKNKQAHLTLTKPVGRAQYLLGKWLGISLLNLVLVAITGVAIFYFTTFIASQREPASFEDGQAVTEQVLVARASAPAQPPPEMNLQERAQARLLTLQQQLPETYGRPGTPMSALHEDTRATLLNQTLSDWTSIGPRDTTAFLFTGLGRAKEIATEVQVRVEPKVAGQVPGDQVTLAFWFNDRQRMPPVPALSVDTPHTISISTQAIDDNGNLLVQVRNPVINGVEQPTVNFNQNDGIEVLYRVDGFSMNLARAMAMIWVRLLFIAMLGLVLGSLVSFPIATLIGLVVTLSSLTSVFVLESIDEYSFLPSEELGMWDYAWEVPNKMLEQVSRGDGDDAAKMVVSLIGLGFMAMIPPLGQYDPHPLIIEGRLVSWAWLGRSALWVGIAWTGGLLFLGYLMFRRKELARVQV